MKLALTLAALTALGIAAGAAFAEPAAAAATASDCKAAANATDHAICSNPAAAKSDAAMRAAFDALIAQSTPENQKVFRDSQQAWLDDRHTDCDFADATDKPAKLADAAKCLIAETNERQRFLTGMPDEGPGATSAIVPVMREGQGFIWSLHFANPTTPGEKLLNDKLDGEVAKLHIGKIDDKGDYIDHDDYTDNLDAALRYASPTLISVAVEGDPYSPTQKETVPFSYNLNIDMQTGKQLSFADAFEPGALAGLQSQCRAQLKEFLAPASDGDSSMVADNTKTANDAVADLNWWSFGAKQVTITMDPGDEDPYACHLPYSGLRKIIKAGFPLPQ